jgi:hypothetical protein
LLNRSYKKQKREQMDKQRKRDIANMSASQIEAYDKRNHVLEQIINWLVKVTKTRSSSNTELDASNFWSSLPDGVVRIIP